MPEHQNIEYKQIRIYDNKFCIWNEGVLPEGLTIDSLKRQHPSRLRNPLIAEVCFKGGFIDAWGRGTLKILAACKDAGLPEPEMKEQDGGFLVTLFKDIPDKQKVVTPQVAPQVTPQVAPQVKLLLSVLEGALSGKDLQKRMSLKDRKSFRELYLVPALEAGLIEMTMPDKPQSSKQKYRLTAEGEKTLAKRMDK